MDANEILKRDAELRAHAAEVTWISKMAGEWVNGPFYGDAHVRPFTYLRAIAAAERALIEAVGAWIEGVKIDPNDNRAQDIDLSKYHLKMCEAYRALLAAMAEAQR